MTIGEFPGYNNVAIAHHTLKIIIGQQEPSWKSALANVKGVYLIFDTANGKTYIGCATGVGGLWRRWAAYAKTGHGDNKELKEVISTHGIEYADNFQYTVLETADSHATREFIEERESYWKDVLLSRQFGYNSN